MTDMFKGDDAALIDSINAAIELNRDGAMVPRIPTMAIELLASAAARLARPTDDAALVKSLDLAFLADLEKEAHQELDAHQEWLNEHPDEPDPDVDWVGVDPKTLISMVAACRALAARGADHSPEAGTMVSGAGQGEAVSWPSACDGVEQPAFEAWAKIQRFDMAEHPLHYLFLDAKTDAARDAWKAGLTYAVERMKSAPPLVEANRGPTEDGIVQVLRDENPLFCGRNCEREMTDADAEVWYRDAARAILALPAAPSLGEG